MVKHGWKGKTIALFTVFLLMAIIIIYIWDRAKVEAAAVTNGVATNNEIPMENNSVEKGTVDNPFVILEIVPYEGYAEIGYEIAGCEPVDVNNLNLRTDGSMDKIASTKFCKTSWVQQYRFPDESSDIPESFTYQSSKITLNGYYEKVAKGTGTFIQQANSDGTTDYIKVATGSGDIVWHTVYGMEDSKKEVNHSLSTVGDRFYTSRTNTGYWTGNESTYENYNYFLKKTLKLTDSEIADYHIVVKTVQPDELNSHLEWIDRADFISISPKSHIGDLPGVWNKYNKVGKTANSNPATNFGGNDLSWEAALRLFNKVVVSDDKAAVLMDCTVYTEPPTISSKTVTPCQIDYNGNMTTNNVGSETGNSNNVYKLAVMLRTMDPVVFYNLFLNTNGGTKAPLIQNGKYLAQKTDDEQFYWSQSTFMPTRNDGSKAWSTYWDSLWDSIKLNYNKDGNVSVSGKVFTYNGDCAPTQHVVDSSVSDTKFTNDFIKYAQSQGMDTSPASAMDFILGDNNNSPNYVKKNLTVLDIEPSNDFTMTDYWIRMMLPYYTGTTSIVSMTSSEFIGKIEDLNSKYDMIYLGLNCGGLNTTKQQVNNNNTWMDLYLPYYNSEKYYSNWHWYPTSSELKLSGLNSLDDYQKLNDDLTGKIYLHVGPRVLANLGNESGAGQTDLNTNWILDSSGNYVDTKGIIRLPGNDITALKVSELNSYLKAGYPILTDTNLYQTDTAFTKLLVDQNSNIYKFVKNAKNGSNKDALIDVGSSSADSKIQALIMKRKLQLTILQIPTEYIGTDATVQGTIDDANYINGTNIDYRNLKFEYKIVGDDTKKYNVYLYIDANADGKYADNEINMQQLGVTPNESHKLVKKLAKDYFGVIPWKLVVREDGNPDIRSEQLGYSAVKRTESQKQEIRILQIINPDPNKVKLNLEQNISDHKLFYTYTNKLNDYKLTFTTKTITQFEDLYQSTRFNCTNADTEKATDKLVKNYDMLIFGFGDSYGDISNSNGALDNVKYFIDSYKSVLFTHDTTSPYNNITSSIPTGYHFNLSFRGIFGMDRFGVRQYNDKDSYNDLDRYQYVDQPTSTNDSGSLYKEIHGYTYFTAAKKANINQNLGFKGILSGPDNSRDGTFVTNVATKLNDGQITQYPYKIDQSFTIANTHGQWNQLNLNDPSIVVWYCLGEEMNNNYSTYKSKGKAIYEVSPNDASNNYYIYNKGNITYSGVGHSANNNDLQPMETKLFVNTIIQSYKAVLKEPAVEVVDGQGSNNNYVTYINTDVNDGDDQSYKNGDMMDIRFIPWDYNFLSHNMGVKAKLADGTSLDIYDTSGNKITDTYSSKTGASMTLLDNGNTYVLKYNKGDFNDANKRTILFTIENEKGLQSTCTLKLMNLTYFDLE